MPRRKKSGGNKRGKKRPLTRAVTLRPSTVKPKPGAKFSAVTVTGPPLKHPKPVVNPVKRSRNAPIIHPKPTPSKFTNPRTHSKAKIERHRDRSFMPTEARNNSVRCTSPAKIKKKRYLIEELRKVGVVIDEPNAFRYNEILDISRENGIETDHRQYNQTLLESIRCQNSAIPGGEVCMKHGGNVPSVVSRAKQRLGEMVMPALTRQMKIINTSKQHGAVMVAIKDVLDRCGLKEAYKIQIENVGDGSYNQKKLDEMPEDKLLALIQLVKELRGEPKQLASGFENAINVTGRAAALSMGADVDKVMAFAGGGGEDETDDEDND